MYIQDKYKLYRMAHSLMTNDEYTLLHVNSDRNIVWLEKTERRLSRVIRLSLQGFDWKNHLKQDMSQALQLIDTNKRLIRGKIVEFYNIYISSDQPVDSWLDLTRPIQLNQRKNITMRMFYFDRENFFDEYHRLHEQVNITLDWIYDVPSETYAEQFVSAFKDQINQQIHSRREEERNIFTYGKPRLTYFLIGLNILVFLLVELGGSSTDIEHLIRVGAKYNPYIIDGEWWRIISSMFLHIGIFHLLMNMLALYYLGHAVEGIFGTGRFFIIYMLAGISGGLASFAFTINVSAGASGAIFGLFGALLFFGLIHKRLFFQTMGTNLLVIIGINLVFGFTVPQIDNSAHLGGLIGGFIAAAFLHLPKHRHLLKQTVALIIYSVAALGLIAFGINEHETSAFYELHQVDQYLAEEQYGAAIELATESIETDDELLPQFLFQRGYAYIRTDEIDLAIADLEQCISLTDELPEAYYNLALLYYETEQYKLAEDMIKKAVQLDPDNEMFKEVYDEIIID